MESIVTDERYSFIQKVVADAVKKTANKLTMSDKIDKIVTNRILGLPIFLLVMGLVYYVSRNDSRRRWQPTVPMIHFVVSIQDAVSGFLASAGANDLIISLVSDGIIGGVSLCWDSFLRWQFYSCFFLFWKTVVTWFVSLSL